MVANSIVLSLIIPNCLWLRISISLSSFNIAHPPGEPGRNPFHFLLILIFLTSFCLFMVGLPSTWGFVDGDRMFFPHFVGGLLFGGDSDRYKLIKRQARKLISGPSPATKARFFFGGGGAAAQRGPWPPSFLMFLDHTKRRTTVGRTPLDE